MAGPLVTLTTDFGLADPSVAACKGVILSIAPDARLMDVSHGIAPYAVAEGAAILSAALPYLPLGVHIAVVDPGVGTDRRPVAIRVARGDFLVGPDNGLLIPAAERLGGVAAARLLSNPTYRLAAVSRTFQARDVFAPAAAHLAMGVAIEDLGPSLAPESLIRLAPPVAASTPGALEASVVFIDAFGSAQILAGLPDLEAALGPVSPGDALVVEDAAARAGIAGVPGESVGAIELRWRRTYGEAGTGEPLMCLDSTGRLLVAVNGGNAARILCLAVNRRLRIRRD